MYDDADDDAADDDDDDHDKSEFLCEMKNGWVLDTKVGSNSTMELTNNCLYLFQRSLLYVTG